MGQGAVLSRSYDDRAQGRIGTRRSQTQCRGNLHDLSRDLPLGPAFSELVWHGLENPVQALRGPPYPLNFNLVLDAPPPVKQVRVRLEPMESPQCQVVVRDCVGAVESLHQSTWYVLPSL